MASKAIIGLIIFLALSLSSVASAVTLSANPPAQYTVVKGDTLWDISAKFLHNPWEWPQVWKHNNHIQNPHLIYPGDVISLCLVGGETMLCVDSNMNAYDSANNSRTLYPHMRPQDTSEAIAMIPVEDITPYLNSPKVVDQHDLENAPYIVDFAAEHIIAGAGDEIFVRSILKADSLSYTTYRPGLTYEDPDTGEILGYEALFIADNIILEIGDPATLRIITTKREVRRGDRLMTTSEDHAVMNFFPKPPTMKIDAAIISVLGGVSQIGQYDIIVLSKGKQDNLEIGHILSIKQTGKLIADPFHKNKNELVKLPNREAGIALVFRVFDRVSYALVMSATRNITVLDRVSTPEI
ncbi:MAG: LysM peptidoglycan-binding domain-containing protein [Methyloprofundus sp.]|nr:LysM peptidoglycan-binding domain-containing protein [Methyloprofundus sp.]